MAASSNPLMGLYGGQQPSAASPPQDAQPQQPASNPLNSLYKPQDVQQITQPMESPHQGTVAQGVGAGLESFVESSPLGQMYEGLKGLGQGALNYATKVKNGETLEDPITYTIHHGIVEPIAEASYQNLKQLPSDLKAGDFANAFADAVGAVPVVGAGVRAAGDALGTAFAGKYDPKTNSIVRDPEEMGQAVGQAAGTVLTTWLGAHPEAAAEVPEQVLRRGQQATEYLIDKAAGKANPSDLMMGALRKDAPKRLDFGKQLDDLAMPAIKDVADRTGTKIDGIDSLIKTGDKPGLIDLAKQHIQDKINAIEGPRRAMGKQFDTTQLASTIRDQITDTMRRQNPALAKRLGKMANRYESASMGVDDMYDELTHLNASLDAYYAKNPAARKLSASANPDIAVEDALARNVRQQLYTWESDPKVGDSLRTARQQYGSLKQLENSLYQRRLSIQRAAPMDLSEKISKWSGTAGIARGVIKTGLGATTGHGAMAVGGLADIGSGVTKLAVGKWLEDYTSTNAMINRAFSKGVKASPHIEVPPKFKPAGLLESGPTRAPHTTSNHAMNGFAVDTVPQMDESGQVTYVPKHWQGNLK